MEQAAVIAAIEEDTHESAVKVRAVTTFIGATIIYGVASLPWGLAFWPHFRAITCSVAAIGAIVGVVSGSIVASQKTPQNARLMQFAAGAFVQVTSLLIAIAGIVALLIRQI